ncbi:phosphatase PAP2 family protein [Constantimarinum furrinae]|uniref:Membrane-associated phospholipid phosphatase n=1 Tax=Constantimarinum furrinae TaxID=2562285 RepID=A0A7G8PR99_9FLAO|nr:phosphatase PAP2 family protein [Constantimarinum furrinae]QNJ96865.1 Membrane-associated phospholipid phosphatase [Constantimarinum furrinae]
MIEILKELDRELFIFLNSLGIERFDAFWLFVTQIESWTPLFILFIFLMYYFYKWRDASATVFFLLLTFGITILFTGIVKEYVARLRPNNVEALAELIRILQKPSNYSFFSGHASSSFSITTFVVLVLRKHTKWIYVAFLWPFIFVLSRIYVGVHYPSDIMVGALVGTVIAYVFYQLWKVETQQELVETSINQTET